MQHPEPAVFLAARGFETMKHLAMEKVIFCVVYLERWFRTVVIGLCLSHSNSLMMMMMMMMMMIPPDGREGSGTGGIKYQEYQKPFS